MGNVTEHMKSALLWLRNRNGDGVFAEKNNKSVLIAGGQRAPIMRATWTRLEAEGLVERYAKRRLRVTLKGLKLNLVGVEESHDQSEYDAPDA